jgi:hypothetical protein
MRTTGRKDHAVYLDVTIMLSHRLKFGRPVTKMRSPSSWWALLNARPMIKKDDDDDPELSQATQATSIPLDFFRNLSSSVSTRVLIGICFVYMNENIVSTTS